MVREWTVAIETKGMELNPRKSKVMLVSKNVVGRNVYIECKGEHLESVSQFKYLGTIISQDGRMDAEITYRVQKATNTYYAISGTIFGKKEVTKKTKTRLHNSIVEPVLTYGCESWPMQNKHASKVTAVQMKVLRRIIGKTRRD